MRSCLECKSARAHIANETAPRGSSTVAWRRVSFVRREPSYVTYRASNIRQQIVSKHELGAVYMVEVVKDKV